MIPLLTLLYYCCTCTIFVPPVLLQQLTSVLEAEDSVLNLHFDHCKTPMKFSWRKLKCECPPPLKKVAGLCVCDNCVYEDIQQWHSEGLSSDVPEFINDVFEEIDSELAEGAKNAAMMAPGGTQDDDEEVEMAKPEPGSALPEEYRIDLDQAEHAQYEDIKEGRRRRSISEEDKSIAFEPILLDLYGQMALRQSPYFSIPWAKILKYYFGDMKVSRPRLDVPEDIVRYNSTPQPDYTTRRRVLLPSPRANVLQQYPRIFYPRAPVTYRGKRIINVNGRPVAPKTYSKSVVGGTMDGSVRADEELAQGSLESYLGTGTMALGAGGGNAGASAFTGMGKSDLKIAKHNSIAEGKAFIGEKAIRGSATTSLLHGRGDVIAANALGQKGSSSVAGFSTQNTAGGASAAYGPASGSISAAPGLGDTSASATYDQNLQTSADVVGEGGPVVESTAVGNALNDIKDINKNMFFRAKPIRFEPVSFNFDKIFGRR